MSDESTALMRQEDFTNIAGTEYWDAPSVVGLNFRTRLRTRSNADNHYLVDGLVGDTGNAIKALFPDDLDSYITENCQRASDDRSPGKPVDVGFKIIRMALDGGNRTASPSVRNIP